MGMSVMVLNAGNMFARGREGADREGVCTHCQAAINDSANVTSRKFPLKKTKNSTNEVTIELNYSLK